MLKKGDIILIISIIIAVTIGFLGMKAYNGGNKHRIAEIIQDKKVIRTIDLDKVEKSETIKLPGQYDEIVLVEKGRIRFAEARCPDRVCVETGWLTKAGDSATCIPNRAMIRIKGENREVDGVAY